MSSPKPKFVVTHGECVVKFYTRYHADQYCRALESNGTPYKLTILD